MIESDGSGYFAYLPQTLIYKTNNFEFISKLKEKYPDIKIDQGVSAADVDGKRTNKYFVGTSICIAPFYFVTHQIERARGGNTDGYSSSYELSVLLAGIAFWFIGMWSIVQLFRKFSLSNFTIVFSLIGLTLATNIYYYTVFHPDFSHIYAFGVVAFLLLQFKIYADRKESKRLIYIGLLLGLLTIIRPTDFFVILLLPFFFQSFKEFKDQLIFIFKNQKIAFILGVLLFLGMIGIQYLNIYLQTGQWRFNEYLIVHEGFDNWLSPKIGEVLFSFRKGFFLYTPFFILLIPGFIELYRWNKYFFVGILSFFAVFIYMMASWWCWWYGGSLGMRPMIDVYAVLILPVALLFEKAKPYFKVVLFVFLFAMMDVNSTYTYQLQNGILHYSEMNKERFMHTFLQTGKRYEWMVFIEEPRFDKTKFKKEETWSYEPSNQKWSLNKLKQLDKEEFTGHINWLLLTPDSTTKNSKITLEVKYDVLIKDEASIPKVTLFGFQQGERRELSVNYLKFQVPRLNRFYEVKAVLASDEKYSQMDSLKVFVDNDTLGGTIKNLRCDVFIPK